MNAAVPEKLHNDHKYCLSEYALWHDEIRAWQGEVEQALADLKRVESALRAHQRALQVHAAAVQLYGQEVLGEEHELATAERRAAEPKTSGPAGGKCELEKHEKQRSDHERTKRVHHALIAHWRLLLKALTPSA